jgi:hypothetical protein
MPEHDRELEREAEWRWGNTGAYAQSRKRTDDYTEEDWARHRAEQDALNQLTVSLMQEGRAPSSVEAMAAAELHRQAITAWFYDCSHQMHAMLAEGYESDERFKASYEAIAPGLAAFHAASVKANALAHGARAEIDDALATMKQSMGLGAPETQPLDVDAAHEAQRPEDQRLSKRERKALKKAERQAKKR